ncbi:hypothetical protein FOL47_010992 [Perkinsus chesapeaki]|uniref:50S ribosomal protein L19, chloroplastic n=1 Tax=Perkinsus chesapeaki TaxID=330153 RepID=A0A7J6L0E0_PERCH|nr:hypothetical protein FOL47_010992 [Perkinsus chesapeaki]
MEHLKLKEIDDMKKKRTFTMPRITLGDLVEVRYEISRSKKTFGTFQGYVIRTANKLLDSTFTLKNSYDGITVEQTFPRYSPRLLDVRVVKSIGSYERDRLDRRPRNRNYRYQWWYYKRHMYSEGYQIRWQAIPQKFGVMSLEPRLGRELALLRRRYNMMRLEAGLPPYVWAGPYQIHQRLSREGKAEQNRRQLLYAYDERRKRALKKKLQRMKVKWGVYKIDKEPRLADGATAKANEEEALARTISHLLDSYMTTKCRLFGVLEHKLLIARQDASRAESDMDPNGINRSLNLAAKDASKAADDLHRLRDYEFGRLSSIEDLLHRSRELTDSLMRMVRKSISESSIAANLVGVPDSSQSLQPTGANLNANDRVLTALIHSRRLMEAADHYHATANAMILAHSPAAKASEQATIADSVMHARTVAVEDGVPAKELERAEAALRHAVEFAKIGIHSKSIEQKILQAIYAKSGIRYAMKEVSNSLTLQQHYSTAPESIASKACRLAAASAREVQHLAEEADMHARDALHALDKYDAIGLQKHVESQIAAATKHQSCNGVCVAGFIRDDNFFKSKNSRYAFL